MLICRSKSVTLHIRARSELAGLLYDLACANVLLVQLHVLHEANWLEARLLPMKPNGRLGRNQRRDRLPNLYKVCGGQFYVGSGLI